MIRFDDIEAQETSGALPEVSHFEFSNRDSTTIRLRMPS